MKASEQRNRMLETPVNRLVLTLCVPTVITQLITVIYNTADTWFVSKISTSASAAVGTALALMSVIQAVGYGFGMGAGSLISRRLGEKREEEAELLAASALTGGLLFGLLILVIGMLLLQPMMRLLGATETMLGYACDYARFILLAAPLMCGTFIFNLILRAEGFARFAMVGMCSGGLLNLLLDPILIFRLEMEIAGAAAATAISQAFSFAILLLLFLKKSVIRLRLRSSRLRLYPQILSNGLPTICRQSLGSIAAALLNNQAAVYGDAAVAAMTIVNKIYTLVRNLILGIGQGFQPVAGFNYGAARLDRTRAAFRFAAVLGTGVGLVFALAAFPFAKEIILWFRDDPEVAAYGTAALRIACLSMPLLAYATFVNQLFQSIGLRARASALASCRQGVFFIPIILLAPRIIDMTGIQIAQPAADLLTFLVSIPFHIRAWKTVLSEK